MRRVVVTGLGVVSPLGTGVKDNWDALLAGRSGIGTITHFDASDLPSQIAGEVTDFDATNYMDKKEVRKTDYFIQYALAAAQMAIEDSGFTIDDSNAERVGTLVGAGLGGLPTIEKYHKAMLEASYKKITPFFIPMLIINLASGQISMRYGAKGPNSATVTACATGSHSIGDAYQIIRRGDADAMFAGGTESTITPLGVGGFCAMKALSCRNDDPQGSSRPFARDRDGFVIAEGCGMLFLEEYEQARQRGATIYGEIVGYGMTSDAYHLTAPAPEGDGARRCMEMALKNAQLPPEAVQYINAHGTSTPFNDLFETKAIKHAFGEHAQQLLVSSTKSMTGHCLGGAGAIEAIYTLLAMNKGIVPPTINLDPTDPECDLDYVPHTPREAQIDYALSNSLGFGGTNASLIFQRL